MRTDGFQVAASQYLRSGAVVADIRPVHGEYASRIRFSRGPHASIRSVSGAGAYFDLLYDEDRVSTVPEVGDPDPAVDELRNLLLLPDDWDRRGAPAPTVPAVEVARFVLREGRSLGLLQARVSPDVEGGVATYFFGGEELPDGGWRLQAGVLSSNDGEVTVYLRDRSTPGAEINDVDATEESLREAIARIVTFIRGS